MVNVKINGVGFNLDKNLTVLQACYLINNKIPKFCFNENLEIAGNCRMCLVEIKNSLKPVASCAMPVFNNMEIFTDSVLVKKSRESVLEFLLLNHPLDCPICDQGGECDLQDLTLYYGLDKSRFFNKKRSVIDKNCGPFIKTVMTRCIHCTRCVRFSKEICKTDYLGTTGRGNNTEISFYLNKIFNSEFSGNLIDLCPVGALISKPFTFKNRSWELKKKKTIDLLDSIGSNVIINTFNNDIVRIIPISNKLINIEWISNKTRFFFDSLKYQRIVKPLLKFDKKFYNISWEKTFFLIKKKIIKQDTTKIKALTGNFLDLEFFFLLKKKMNFLGINNLNYSFNKHNIKKSSDIPNNYLFKNSFKDFNDSNLFLLINFNPKLEGSVLKIFLLNSIKKNSSKIATIGSKGDLIFNSINLGLSVNILFKIIEGKHSFCTNLLKSKNPLIILGSNIFNFYKFKFNLFFNESSFLNFLEINFNKNYYKKQNYKLLLLYNTDINNLNKNSFKIYQGHHFSNDAQNSNLIIPSLTFLEKKGLYLNIHGLIQISNKIIKDSIKKKKDLNILKNSFFCFFKKNINNNIFSILPYLYNFKLLKINKISFYYKKKRYIFSKKNSFLINNLYFNNILEKNSKILINSISIHENNNFLIL